MKENEIINEELRFTPKKVHFQVFTITGKEGEYFIRFAPSLNVSGYGKTMNEALESFKHNFDVFLDDMLELKIKERDKYLISLGFKKVAFKNKNYSNVFIDSDGAIKGLELEDIQKELMVA